MKTKFIHIFQLFLPKFYCVCHPPRKLPHPVLPVHWPGSIRLLEADSEVQLDAAECNHYKFGSSGDHWSKIRCVQNPSADEAHNRLVDTKSHILKFSISSKVKENIEAFVDVPLFPLDLKKSHKNSCNQIKLSTTITPTGVGPQISAHRFPKIFPNSIQRKNLDTAKMTTVLALADVNLASAIFRLMELCVHNGGSQFLKLSF